MEWTTVKAKKRRTKKPNLEQLKIQHPHLITQRDAEKIAEDNNIRGLVEKFSSEHWINLQLQQWRFVRVIKPEDRKQIPTGNEFITLDLENGYGDAVLFKHE